MSDKTKYRITEINVTLCKGSFADWAESSEEQTEADIERWEAAYNEQCEAAIKKVFPFAAVYVSEGPDQFMGNKYDIEFIETSGSMTTNWTATPMTRGVSLRKKQAAMLTQSLPMYQTTEVFGTPKQNPASPARCSRVLRKEI